MKTAEKVLLFRIGTLNMGILLEPVIRVIRAVELEPWLSAPEGIKGLFRLDGMVVPVICIRSRIGLPEKSITPEDRIILARRQSHIIGIVVNEILETQESDTGVFHEIRGINRKSSTADGVLIQGDELSVIYNLEQFLSASIVKSISRTLG